MHIFISYAKSDTRDLALQLRDAFIALPNVSAWMDTSLNSGEDWAAQIQDEIDRADLVVVLLSQDVSRPANHPSGRSFVLKEIHYAQQVKKTIIPILVQKVKIPVQLAGIEYIDLTSNQTQGIQRLLKDVLRLTGSAQIEGKSADVTESNFETQKRRFMHLPKRPPRSWYISTFVLAALTILALVFSRLSYQGSLASGLVPIPHNADWTPHYDTFNGFEMALVPIGCFMMGSTDGEDDEKPVNQQCFDQPFWIDRYEVTNQQYGSEGNSNRPRAGVTWFQARDFCVQRGARLPTEREWEYAARGPSNLVYPWGNDFVPDNVVYSGNSNQQSADVGSRHKGDSWVDASDLSGNLWEWVSSVYQPYPYKTDDGRELDTDSTAIRRLLRGGSGLDYGSAVRASDRFDVAPTYAAGSIGFRCARLY
jgi:formylglycine-generating enzyme required for sulfatase activity